MYLILICFFLFSNRALSDAKVSEIPLDPNSVKESVDKKLAPSENCDSRNLNTEIGIKNKKIKDFKDVVICVLNKTHPNLPPSAKRRRTLNFISSRMVDNFESYNIQSNVEKSHFLANILKETGGLSTTVEKTFADRWENVIKDSNPQKWDCAGYEYNIQMDKDYFNDSYSYSKDTYKADFRGRGLIQLTHCYNYLGFFYHKAALKAGRQDLALKNKTDFYYREDNGDVKRVGKFCDVATLKKIENEWISDGLKIEPGELVNNFRKTIDHLSVPCSENRVGKFSSQEFIVDSSFWFWQSCRKRHSDSLTDPSDDAKVKFNNCVHGGAANYSEYKGFSCPENNSNKPFSFQETKWIHRSWCHRKNYFNAFKECFEKQ